MARRQRPSVAAQAEHALGAVADALGKARNDVLSVLDRDPAARSPWEVALLYPGVHAVWSHRVAHRLWKRGAQLPARAVSQAARALTGIEIHPAAQIGPGLFIDHGSGVVIGETAEIGRDVTIYHGVTLGGTSLSTGKRHPTIGDRVTVGAGAKVLGPVEVGHDSRIGANAVLVRSVDPHAVVVGVPGQVIAHGTPATEDAKPKVDLAPADPVGETVQALLRRVERLEREATPNESTTDATTFRHTGEVWELDYAI